MRRTHVVDVYRQTGQTVGDGGAREPTYTRVHQSVAVNLSPKSGGLRQMAYGKETAAFWVGYFPAGTAVLANDELVVTEGDGESQYTVLFVGPWDGWDTEVDLQRSTKKVTT